MITSISNNYEYVIAINLLKGVHKLSGKKKCRIKHSLVEILLRNEITPKRGRTCSELKIACSQNNSEANYYLGLCHLYGYLFPKHGIAAERYLTIAARLGSQKAAWLLAGLKMRGIEGIDVDVIKGKALLNDLIKAKDPYYAPRALVLLAEYNLWQENSGKALDCYLEAANKYNYPKASLHAGIILYSINKNSDAARHFNKAYNAGVAEATLFIGELFMVAKLNGLAKIAFDNGLKRNVIGANFGIGKLLGMNGTPFVIKALKAGYSPFNCRIDDAFVPFHRPEELEKLDRDACVLAGRQNVPEAFITLGTYHSSKKNHALALAYFEKVAELGNALALERVGTQIINENPTKGIECLTKAIYMGDPIARDSLAEYWNNQGDHKQAISLYLASNTKISHYQLAEMNYGESYQYALKSAKAGFVPAMVLLGKRLLEGSVWPKNVLEAKSWYEEAAILNDPVAIDTLGRAHYLGTFGERDLDEAVHYFAQKNGGLAAGFGLKANLERKKISKDLYDQIKLHLSMVEEKKNNTIPLLEGNTKLISLVQEEFDKYFKAINNRLNIDVGIKMLNKAKTCTIKCATLINTICDNALKIHEKTKLENAKEKARIAQMFEATEQDALDTIERRILFLMETKKKITQIKKTSNTILNDSTSPLESIACENSYLNQLKAIISVLDYEEID